MVAWIEVFGLISARGNLRCTLSDRYSNPGRTRRSAQR